MNMVLNVLTKKLPLNLKFLVAIVVENQGISL